MVNSNNSYSRESMLANASGKFTSTGILYNHMEFHRVSHTEPIPAYTHTVCVREQAATQNHFARRDAIRARVYLLYLA